MDRLVREASWGKSDPARGPSGVGKTFRGTRAVIGGGAITGQGGRRFDGAGGGAIFAEGPHNGHQQHGRERTGHRADQHDHADGGAGWPRPNGKCTVTDSLLLAR